MQKKFRLAAIDIDGTLIHGHSRAISDANRRAVARMQAQGIEVVLASGRHHGSMLKYAAQLPGVRWMVSSQGAEISDTTRREMLLQVFLEPDTAQHLITLGRSLGYAIVVYADDGVYRLDAPEKIAAYAGLDGGKIAHLPDAEALAKRLFKVMWTGNESCMLDIEHHPEVATLEVSHVRTHTYLYELLPHNITKGTGVAHLAAHLGTRADETIVFGDAENDIPMFQWAGVSVAMPGIWKTAQASATMIAPGEQDSEVFARGAATALGW